MKIWGVFLSLSFMSTFASAVDLEVRPLYKDDTLKTHLSLPFQVKGQITGFGALTGVEIASSTTSCRTLIDPNIHNNFFVKCSEAEDVNLYISYTVNGQSRRVSYGPMQIRKISETGTVVDGGGGTNEPTAEWLLGETVFANKCANCHYPAEKADRTSLQSLNSAISSVPPMRSIVLTDAEKAAIVTYVQSFR